VTSREEAQGEFRAHVHVTTRDGSEADLTGASIHRLTRQAGQHCVAPDGLGTPIDNDATGKLFSMQLGLSYEQTFASEQDGVPLATSGVSGIFMHPGLSCNAQRTALLPLLDGPKERATKATIKGLRHGCTCTTGARKSTSITRSPEDVKVLELKPDHAVVRRFDERDQDALCGPAENKTAPQYAQTFRRKLLLAICRNRGHRCRQRTASASARHEASCIRG
jgi:hypothetical protein